jgi:hypothetical protein
VLTMPVAAQRLLQDLEIRKMHHVRPLEFHNFEINIRRNGILDEAAMIFLSEPHDFTTTRNELISPWIDSIIYGPPRRWASVLMVSQNRLTREAAIFLELTSRAAAILEQTANSWNHDERTN